MKTLGLLAVGQSPRTDYVPVISSFTGPSVRIVEKGVLDGLDRAQMSALAPLSPQEHPVVTRLADGSSVTMSKAEMSGIVNDKLREFARSGVDLAVLMCTGDFQGIVCPEGLHMLYGKDIIDGCVRAAVPAGSRLGVLVPLASQEAFSGRKFFDMGYDAVTAHASPYGSMEEIEKAASAFRGCFAVILHCMGYVRRHRKAVAEISGAMVLEANALVGHMCSELLSS